MTTAAPAAPTRQAAGRVRTRGDLLPWSRAQLVVLLAIAAIGALITGIGWFGASGTTDWGDQVTWIAIGGIGAMVGAVAGTCWLVFGFGAVHHRTRYLTSVLEPAVRTTAFDSTETHSRGVAVSTQTMTRFHRAECPLVRGKSTQSERVEDLRARGRRPCGVCKP